MLGGGMTVRELVADGLNVNAADQDGQTMLHYAAYYGNTIIAQDLLKMGADIDAKDKQGRTPVMIGSNSQYANPNTIQFLIAYGCDLNAKDADGKTAQDWAKKGRSRQIMELLDAATPQTADGFLPGAAGQYDPYGCPTSEVIASRMKPMYLRRPVISGYDPQHGPPAGGAGQDGDEMLAAGQKVKVAAFFCNGNRADVVLYCQNCQLVDRTGRMLRVKPEAWAQPVLAGYGNRDEFTLQLKQFLSDNPLEPTPSNSMKDQPPLSVPEKGKQILSEALMESLRSSASPGKLMNLADCGADVNYQPTDQEKRTILIEAVARSAEPKIARYLLSSGAAVNTVDEKGRTALMYAVAARNPEMVRALINAGADVNATTANGETAIMFAATEELVDALLAAGARADVRNSDGRTALGMAVGISRPQSFAAGTSTAAVPAAVANKLRKAGAKLAAGEQAVLDESDRQAAVEKQEKDRADAEERKRQAEEDALKKMPLAQLTSRLVRSAARLQSVKATYYQLDYQLKYRTTSGMLQRRVSELENYMKNVYVPAEMDFVKYVGEYAERKGGMALRDLAIQYDFLDLLR